MWGCAPRKLPSRLWEWVCSESRRRGPRSGLGKWINPTVSGDSAYPTVSTTENCSENERSETNRSSFSRFKELQVVDFSRVRRTVFSVKQSYRILEDWARETGTEGDRRMHRLRECYIDISKAWRRSLPSPYCWQKTRKGTVMNVVLIVTKAGERIIVIRIRGQ